MLHVHPCWFVSELIVSVRVAFNSVTTNAQMPCFFGANGKAEEDLHDLRQVRLAGYGWAYQL